MKIKKYIAILLTVLLTAGNTLTVCAEEYQIRAPHMYAHSYAVMDANTGEILFGENVDKQIYPASTAKLMSAIVTVESDTPLDTIIKTKSSIVKHTTLGTYDIGLKGGEHYSLECLLNMCLIASAADATDTIADALYGSREAFAKKMMEKVEKLGLTNTSFDNPVGSDIGGGFYGTYSTAREMCEITRYAMSIPTIRKIVRKSSYTIKGDGSQDGRKISNTNIFYTTYPYNKDMFTIIGSKTGQTTAAGNVFIATAIDNEGHELICAYFGRDTKKETFRWIDNLLTYAFKNYNEGNLDLSKGAYNARYHEGSTAIIRAINEDIFMLEKDKTVNLETVITKEQAVAMIRAVLESEIIRTGTKAYFDSIGKTNSLAESICTKEFFKEAVLAMIPGFDNIHITNYYINQLADEVTLAKAGTVLTSFIKNYHLYEMTLPSLEIRTWTMDDPVPFMSTPKLPTGFIDNFQK